MNLEIGDEVYWNDPNREEDEGCSGYGTILKIKGDIYCLKMEDGGEVDAIKDELT